MRVSIRADWCIALRMIALQEYYRISQEFAEKFLRSQEYLGEEFEKVLYDNLEELYED